MSSLYYTPPPEECFVECKEKAILIWQSYSDEFGYASEKVSRIKNISNIEDNFIYIVAMFDIKNQVRLSKSLSDKTKKEIMDRLIDGGTPESLIFF